MSELRVERHSAGSLHVMQEQFHLTGSVRGMPLVLVLGSIDDEHEGLQHQDARNHNLRKGKCGAPAHARMPLSFDGFLLDDNLQVSGHVFVELHGNHELA
jgi:hypothetical protein